MSQLIENFRKKYPDYDDLSDRELSVKLAAKYPQYLDDPDFSDEVSKNKVKQEEWNQLENKKERARSEGTSAMLESKALEAVEFVAGAIKGMPAAFNQVLNLPRAALDWMVAGEKKLGMVPTDAPLPSQMRIISPENAGRAYDFLNPFPPSPEGGAGAGIRENATETVSGLSDPVTAASMAVPALGKIPFTGGRFSPAPETLEHIGTYFQGQMISSIPEAQQKLLEAKGTQEQVNALLSLAQVVGFPAAIEYAKSKGVTHASSIKKATEIYGDVQSQSGQGQGQVSVQEGGKGVQLPTEDVAKGTQVPLVEATSEYLGNKYEKRGGRWYQVEGVAKPEEVGVPISEGDSRSSASSKDRHAARFIQEIESRATPTSTPAAPPAAKPVKISIFQKDDGTFQVERGGVPVGSAPTLSAATELADRVGQRGMASATIDETAPEPGTRPEDAMPEEKPLTDEQKEEREMLEIFSEATAAAGLPVQVENKLELDPNNAPFTSGKGPAEDRLKVMVPSGNGIVLFRENFRAWIGDMKREGLSREKIEESIRYAVDEEDIHRLTTDDDGQRFYDAMSPWERNLRTRGYLGKGKWDPSEVDPNTGQPLITNVNLGKEAIRSIIQKLNNGNTRETVSAMWRERVTVQTVNALADIIRTLRPKANRVQNEIINRVQGNIDAYKQHVAAMVAAGNAAPGVRRKSDEGTGDLFNDDKLRAASEFAKLRATIEQPDKFKKADDLYRRAQGASGQGAPPGVSRKGVEADDMTPDEQRELKHGDGIRFGLSLSRDDIPDMESKYNQAGQDMVKSFQSNDGDAQQAAFGRMNFYGGALQGVTRGEHKAAAGNFARFAQDFPGEVAPGISRKNIPPEPIKYGDYSKEIDDIERKIFQIGKSMSNPGATMEERGELLARARALVADKQGMERQYPHWESIYNSPTYYRNWMENTPKDIQFGGSKITLGEYVDKRNKQANNIVDLSAMVRDYPDHPSNAEWKSELDRMKKEHKQLDGDNPYYAMFSAALKNHESAGLPAGLGPGVSRKPPKDEGQPEFFESKSVESEKPEPVIPIPTIKARNRPAPASYIPPYQERAPLAQDMGIAQSSIVRTSNPLEPHHPNIEQTTGQKISHPSGATIQKMTEGYLEGPIDLKLGPREEFSSFSEWARRKYPGITSEEIQKMAADKTYQDLAIVRHKTRPSFSGFVRWMKASVPYVQSEQVRALWIDSTWKHLINASGVRLEQWRQVFNLEGEPQTEYSKGWGYGKRTIADPPKVEWEKMMSESMGPLYQKGELTEERIKDMRKSYESRQRYRNKVIARIGTKMSEEAMREVSMQKEEISLDNIDFSNEKTEEGAYRVINSSEASSPRILDRILRDQARPDSTLKLPPTATHRLAVLVNKRTGQVHIVGAYPEGRYGVMVVSPSGGTGIKGKPHEQLKAVMPYFRVISSILTDEPMQYFHQIFPSVREFTEAIGKEATRRDTMAGLEWAGEAADPRRPKIRSTLVLGSEEEAPTGTPKETPTGLMETGGEAPPEGMRGEAAEEEAALPESGVTQGEGGGAKGPGADVFRSASGLRTGELLRRSDGQPMTAGEAMSLKNVLDAWEVESPQDVVEVFKSLSLKAGQRLLRNKKYGLRGEEYQAIAAIDKAVAQHYRNSYDPVTKEYRLDPQSAALAAVESIYKLIYEPEDIPKGEEGYISPTLIADILSEYGEGPGQTVRPSSESAKSPADLKMEQGRELNLRRPAEDPYQARLRAQQGLPDRPAAAQIDPNILRAKAMMSPDAYQRWLATYSRQATGPEVRGASARLPKMLTPEEEAHVATIPFTDPGMLREMERVEKEHQYRAARAGKPTLVEEALAKSKPARVVRKVIEKVPEFIIKGQEKHLRLTEDLRIETVPAKPNIIGPTARTVHSFEDIYKSGKKLGSAPGVSRKINLDPEDLKRTTEEVFKGSLSGLSAFIARGGTRAEVYQHADALEGAGNWITRQAENSIRVAASQNVPKGKVGKQAIRDRLGAARAVIGTGELTYEGIDPVDLEGMSPAEKALLGQWTPQKSYLNRFEAIIKSAYLNTLEQGEDGKTRIAKRGINSMLRSNDWRDRTIGKRWDEAAQKLLYEIRYARDHWEDPELQETVNATRKALQEQLEAERGSGRNVEEVQNYIPGIMEEMVWDTSGVAFASQKYMGKNYGMRRSFDNAYEAIAAGPYIPASYDVASLAGSRINRGQMAMARTQLMDTMKNMEDPVLKTPMAVEPIPIRTEHADIDPETGEDISYTSVRYKSPSLLRELVTGGGENSKPLAVLRDYVPVVDNVLTRQSALARSPYGHTALAVNAMLKHGLILIFDTFHLGRLSQYALAVGGHDWKSFQAGWNGGYSALSYAPADLPKAVSAGLISQAHADWATTPINLKSGTRELNLTRQQLAQHMVGRGLNAIRIADALYKDAVARIPVVGKFAYAVVGPMNRFTFDKVTPGLIIESAVRNFERMHKEHPNMDVNRLIQDVVTDTNVMYGNMGRQGVFKNPLLKDLAQIFLLAPFWYEGLLQKELRFYSRTANLAAKTISGGKLDYRSGLPAMGEVGRGVGRGLLAYLALTQMINLVTRGHLTTQNKEKGHKLDAWMPTPWEGENSGLWLSPMSVFAEFMHDITRLGETKPKTWDVIAQIGENRLGPAGRSFHVLTSGTTPSGQVITTTGGVLSEAAKQFAPLPISLATPGKAALHAVAPSLVGPVRPGGVTQRTLGAVGIKTTIGETGPQLIFQMANDFMAKNKLKRDTGWQQVETDQPSYSKLRQQIRMGDEAGAQHTMDFLRKTHQDQEIMQSMFQSSRRPFTGGELSERKFLHSLSPQEMEMYHDALKQRMENFTKFQKWYLKTQKGK